MYINKACNQRCQPISQSVPMLAPVPTVRRLRCKVSASHSTPYLDRVPPPVTSVCSPHIRLHTSIESHRLFLLCVRLTFDCIPRSSPAACYFCVSASLSTPYLDRVPPPVPSVCPPHIQLITRSSPAACSFCVSASHSSPYLDRVPPPVTSVCPPHIQLIPRSSPAACYFCVSASYSTPYLNRVPPPVTSVCPPHIRLHTSIESRRLLLLYLQLNDAPSVLPVRLKTLAWWL
jgi:hypothetical protein